MKILDTLTFVLIAGILNSVVADGESPAPENGETVPDYVHFLGYTNTTLEDIKKFDKYLCDKNGGPNAYAAYGQSFRQYSACVKTLRDELMEETRNYSPLFQFYEPSAAFKSSCRKVSQYENCLKPFVNSIKTCLDPEEQEGADIGYNTTSRVLRFVCEDDAARLVELISHSRDLCIVSKSPALTKCGNRTIGKYIQETVSDGATLAGLGTFHLFPPNLERCNVSAEFQHCVIDELKACGNHPAVNILNSVFNIMQETGNCVPFLESHAVTSPGSDLHPGK